MKEFKVGQVVRCLGASTITAKHAKLRKGEVFIVHAVDRSPSGSAQWLSVTREGDSHPIWSAPLFPARDFELVEDVDGQY